MAQSIELLIKAKADTDAAFKAVLKQLKDTDTETKKISKSFEGLSGLSFQFNQISAAIGTVANWAKMAAGELLALAERGGQVSAVSASFEALSRSLGETGDAMLGAVREGTKGLVSDFDIMLASNKAMLLGLPITAKEMGTLSNAALTLGKTMGLTTTKALDDLITGLGRGSPLILDNLGITIKLEDAYQKYAATLGKTASQLTEAEKKTAFYNAAVAAAQESVNKLGDAQVTTADRLTQLQTGWQNFTDMMGLAIARSPVLNAGLGALADAVQRAFGANQAKTIQTLIGFVNEFAIIVAKGASATVSAAQVIYSAWNYALVGAKLFATGVAGYLSNIAESLKFMVGGLAGLPGAMGAPFRAAQETLESTSEALKRFGQDALVSAEKQTQSFAAGSLALDKLKAGVDGVIVKMEGARGKILAVGAASVSAGRDGEGLGKAHVAAAEKASQGWDKVMKLLRKEESDLTKWVQKEAKARTDAIVKGLAEEMIAAREAAEDRRQSYEEMSGAMLDAIERRRQAELDAQQDMANALGQLGDLFESLGGSAGEALASIAHGFSAGLNAATAFAQATNVAQKAMAALGAVQSAFNSGSVLGGAATGAAFGAQFGIIGAGIGAVGGALLGFFGKAKKAREEMQKLRNEFVQSAGGLNALKAQAAAAGLSLDGIFKAKSAQQLSIAIDVIKGKLQDWDEAQKILTEGMSKYGIAVEDMGAKFASIELDKQAREMALFFAAATQIGANATAVTAGMKDEVLALVAQYQAAGLAIPSALRPVLEAMLKNGQLTKENGEAYGSLEEAGITFAETMEGALSKIGDEINKLMQVLARGFNIPINFEVNGSPTAPSGAGGKPPEANAPEFANAYVPYRPGGTLGFVGERHDEYALEEPKLKALMAQAVAMAGAQNGGGWVIHNIVNMGTRTVWKEASQATRRRQMQVQPNSLRRF